MRDRRFARHSPQLVVATFLAHIVRSSILQTCLQARLIGTRRTDRRQHRQPTAVPHSERARREPLTRGRPTERRFAGCADPRRGGRFLDPSGRALPGRGEGEESFSVFRIARRLGPGQALTDVGAVLLRGHGHTDHLRGGDATPKGEARLSKSAHCTRAASNGALQKSRRDGRRFRAGAVVRVLGESR